MLEKISLGKKAEIRSKLRSWRRGFGKTKGDDNIYK
jgi:hypothetical protein